MTPCFNDDNSTDIPSDCNDELIQIRKRIKEKNKGDSATGTSTKNTTPLSMAFKNKLDIVN